MTLEELNKINVCKELLPDPGPEVVGTLIAELKRWMYAADLWDCDSPQELIGKITTLPEIY